jgi:hypothetical protein
MVQFVRGEPLSSDDIEMDPALEFIPPHLHSQIFKSFYTGYQAVFRGIAHVLSKPPNLPLPSTVNRPYSLDPSADFYFRKGGKVEYALACLIHSAEEQSGDGTFEEMWEDEDMGLDTGLEVCANDDDFELVRMKLGLDARIGYGPYRVDVGGEEAWIDIDSD